MNSSDLTKLQKAGSIASQTVAFARDLIKKDMPLLEIAEKTEAHIEELGGKPAFPVNLSINEIAAHATPSHDDASRAHGLLKVDIGVHVSGFVADTAFSLDLENSEKNQKLITAAEAALAAAVQHVLAHPHTALREIGRFIADAATAHGVETIRNLSGHSIAPYEIHAGITIPNYDNAQEKLLNNGVYAIEPFTTTGIGTVRDGKPSGIYAFVKQAAVRDPLARQLLAYILANYNTLPFCSRWLTKQFGTRALLALTRLEQAGILHQYPQLIEQSKHAVAQAEHTLVITEKEAVVITL